MCQKTWRTPLGRAFENLGVVHSVSPHTSGQEHMLGRKAKSTSTSARRAAPPEPLPLNLQHRCWTLDVS